MKRDQVISATMLIAGVILLCAGVGNNIIEDRQLAIAGAVLIGSWYIGHRLTK